MAAEMGSSDPDVHRAECELWEKMGWAASSRGLPPGPPFEAAEAACGRAVRSSSKEAGRWCSARSCSWRAFMCRAARSRRTRPPGGGGARGRRGRARARPGTSWPTTRWPGPSISGRGSCTSWAGRPPWQPAIAAYERVLSLEPRLHLGGQRAGGAYLARGQGAGCVGQEAAPLLESAIRQYERAMDARLPVSAARGRQAGGVDGAARSRARPRDETRGSAPGPGRRGVPAREDELQPRSSPSGRRASAAPRPAGVRARPRSREVPRIAVEAIRPPRERPRRIPGCSKELALCRLLEAEHARSEGLDPAARRGEGAGRGDARPAS